jgi:SIR2-like domain
VSTDLAAVGTNPTVAVVSTDLIADGIRSGPRPIAVLAGAGVSRSAGIPTGEDLLARAARERGQAPSDDPVPQYQVATGAFPDYFAMTGATPDRDALPSQPYRDASPGVAHRMIARLVVAGWVGPVLTTNLDPLLERALAEAGARVPVAFDLATMAGADLGGPAVIKLHGDYRDIGIRRTAPAPHRYHPVIDGLLDRVLAGFDLLVCGWSAGWDLPLGEALGRADGRRIHWLQCGPTTAAARRIMRVRRPAVAAVPGSDAGLSALVKRLLESTGTAGELPRAPRPDRVPDNGSACPAAPGAG